MPRMPTPNDRSLMACITLLTLACLSGQALALKPDNVPLQKKLRPHASVDDIARQIGQQPHWQILAAEPMVEDTKTLYRFKLLNKKHGRVKIIVVDPEQPKLEQFNLNRQKPD